MFVHAQSTENWRSAALVPGNLCAIDSRFAATRHFSSTSNFSYVIFIAIVRSPINCNFLISFLLYLLLPISEHSLWPFVLFSVIFPILISHWKHFQAADNALLINQDKCEHMDEISTIRHCILK